MNELTSFDIYLWTRLDNVRFALGMLTLLSALFSFLYYANSIDSLGTLEPGKKLAMLCGLFAFFVCGAGTILAPSKQDFALMYVLPRIAQSDAIQRDLPDLYRVAVDALKRNLSKEDE